MTFCLISDIEKGDKNFLVKKRIITYYIYNVSSTIPELSKELNLSIPTVTKFINEMCEEGIINDLGKIDSKGGRRPSTYGLNPQSGYFLGVDIKNNHINIGISNFSGEIVKQNFDIPYENGDDSVESLNDICAIILDFIKASGIPKNKIYNSCVNISGRVNPISGYSFSRFNFAETAVADRIAAVIGVPTCIDNDTRSMAYGEYLRGCIDGEKNILYINIGWGLGLGIIINGVVYGGKSGFAGEIGHVNVFNNEIMCHCGKKGCLETEVSGMALHRQLVDCIREGKSSVLSAKIQEDGSDISLTDIVDAINGEDLLCIELIEEIGQKLGKQIAGLINIFNPEAVVIGGVLSAAEEYLLQPVRQAVRKYSLNLVSKDSRIVCSKLHEKAGIIGACMMARSRMFEEI